MTENGHIARYTDTYAQASQRPQGQGEKKYNYLDEYMNDTYAEVRGLEPIVFDMSRVSNITPLEEVEGWADSPMGKAALKMGLKVHKYIVSCPNPRHSMFKTLLPDYPQDWSYRCPHCITEEMVRVDSLRTRRYLEDRRRS